MDTSIGLITIGQTPRPDLERVFAQQMPRAGMHMIGALDGLALPDIHALRGEEGECPLLCKLADGTTCEVSLNALTPRIVTAAQTLASRGAQIIVVLCTGDFPDIPCAVPVLLPGRVLPHFTKGISRTGNVGVVTSVRGQVPFAEAKWIAQGFAPSVVWASPFLLRETEQAIDRLKHAEPEIIVLDCFGHDAAYKQEFVRALQRPVIVAQTLVAGVARELLH